MTSKETITLEELPDLIEANGFEYTEFLIEQMATQHGKAAARPLLAEITRLQKQADAADRRELAFRLPKA